MGPGCWLLSALTLAVMILVATWDFRTAGQMAAG